jgi:hypothetical protein
MPAPALGPDGALGPLKLAALIRQNVCRSKLAACMLN